MRAAYGGQDWALIEDRVLMGATSPLAATQKYVVNQTGGSDTITLTTANMPSHNHSYSKSSSSTNSTTLTTSQMPSHSHNIKSTSGTYPSSDFTDKGFMRSRALNYDTNNTNNCGATGGGGSHSHSITLTSTSTSSTGSGTAIASLPPYYTVYTWTRTV